MWWLSALTDNIWGLNIPLVGLYVMFGIYQHSVKVPYRLLTAFTNLQGLTQIAHLLNISNKSVKCNGSEGCRYYNNLANYYKSIP